MGRRKSESVMKTSLVLAFVAVISVIQQASAELNAESTTTKKTDADGCFLKMYKAPKLQGDFYTDDLIGSTNEGLKFGRKNLSLDFVVKSFELVGNSQTCCFTLFSKTEGWKKGGYRGMFKGGQAWNIEYPVRSFRRMAVEQCSKPSIGQTDVNDASLTQLP